MIFRLIEVPSLEYSIATDPSAARMTGARLAPLGLPVFRYSRRTPLVVVPQISVSYLTPSAGDAGAGDARNRTMSDKISRNILPGHLDLGHLKRDVAAVADHLGAS
jgi:hypothetical protein